MTLFIRQTRLRRQDERQGEAYRIATRWGLYHYRTDYPERNDDEWLTFVEVRKGRNGQPEVFRRAIPPYLFQISETERGAYDRLRIEDRKTDRAGVLA